MVPTPPHPSRRHALALLGAALAAPALLRPRAARAMPEGAAIRARVRDLDEPWSFAFLPDGGVLVTERAGRLSLFGPEGGRPRARIAGLPEVRTGGQAGLFDVMLPRDFASSREVFLVWANPQGRGAGTALGAGRLSPDGTRLDGFRILFEVPPGGRGGRHFGGRVLELPDGTLALTSGDRGDDPSAQDPGSRQGKLLRLARDGSVPADNPFAGRPGFAPEILSLGHRNPQGMALDAAGTLWASEHGARGGDEVNRIRPGANYGWPVISYGTHYSGAKIGTGTTAPGLEQPAHYWDPSIAPSGHLVHSGRMFPEWQGRHLVGSLKLDRIDVLDPTASGPGGWAGTIVEGPETGRVRDLREAPDGAVWFLSVNAGALFRLARGAA